MRPPGIQLGSIAGTSLTLQPGFLILGGLFVLLDLESGVPMERALLWLPVLFLSILLHELGHAAAFGMFGQGPSVVLLTSYGGLTINRGKTRAWQDVLISLAGPFTSFAITAASYLLVATVPFVRTDPMLVALVPLLAQSNLLWGVFNLIPIHPLDGGQAFRSFLRTFTGEPKATVISTASSMLFAAAMIVLGLFMRWFFLAVVAGLLLMQNYQIWQVIKRGPPPDDAS